MRSIILLLSLLFQIAFSQDFADKDYYLVDSLVLADLSDFDRGVVDSCLILYHQEDLDTLKLNLISFIVEESREENVWSKYNMWLYNYSKKNLNDPINSIFYRRQYAASLNNIGYLYDNQGDISKSLDCYHQSLRIQKEIGDKKGMASSLNNIGYIYNYQDDYVEALKYFYESLKINEELEDEEMIAKGLNNIGFVYYSQNDTAKALDYFQKSLKVRNKIGDDFGVSIALNNIGRIYIDQNHDSLALNLFQRALIISESIDDQKGVAVSLSNIGSMYFDRGDVSAAKKLFLKAYDLSLSMGYPAYISSFSNHLSEIAVKENNYKDAYEMYKLHIIYRDSANNIETQKAAIQERTKYEYETQKADDDVENNKLITIEKEQKEKQELITYAVVASLGLVALFLGFVFNRLHITKKQKIEIEDQKIIVEETHKKITDSINYAKHLQNAILPAFSEIDKHIQENFILFQPKDVVSGDFYWFEYKDVESGDKSLIASADCTGHGVPGAMISVVCSNALDRAVNEFGILEPSKILDKTRELVIETFAKSGDDVRDGMDIALCVFTDNKVVFSGANNPLWIVRDVKYLTQDELELKTTVVIENKALIEFKSNKQPIGLYERMVPFSQVDVELKKGDIIYIFTDGFADQFGGEKHKKFKYEPFKRLLIRVSGLPMSLQKEKIAIEFKAWKKDLDQVDDICIIGIKPIVK